MKKIEFFRHNIDRADRARVSDVLQTIFLTTGSFVQEFEEKFSHYLNLRSTVGMTSCTAGLHLSLVALGIGPGDEVITTPMSFCATANAVLHAGAKPVFVDVEEETGNLNAELLESRLSKKTKAIISVPLYGQRLDNAATSPRLHYRDFLATTDCSVPVSRIGTLILVGPPLEFLPLHLDDRFPRSAQKPEPRSCHLYAGCRTASTQPPSVLIPGPA